MIAWAASKSGEKSVCSCVHSEINIQVANPECSLWVGASAGSGKTKILVDRIIVLLLYNQRRLLCLTFTNAAVKEVKKRVFSVLARWRFINSEEIAAALSQLLMRTPNQEEIARARILYSVCAQVLRVHTVHSFCAGIVQSQPVDVIDGAEAKLLLLHALKYVMTSYEGIDPKWNIYTILEVIISLVARYGATLTSEQWLNETLANLFKIEAQECSVVDCAVIDSIVSILESGSDSERDRSAMLRTHDVENYIKVFLCKDLAPKKIHSIISRKLSAKHPWVLEAILAEQKKVLQLAHTDLLHAFRGNTANWLILVQHVVVKYQQIKFGRRTYDDLIRDFFANVEHDIGILYNADKQIDHLLVDEAQDNSVDHWRIIANVCSEFFAGESRSAVKRTIMIVGDVKQSVYSFMGADPAVFLAMRGYFEGKVRIAGLEWVELGLDQSFRTAHGILSFIDQFFNFSGKAHSLDHSIACLAHRSDICGGHVEFWTEDELFCGCNSVLCNVVCNARFLEPLFLFDSLVSEIKLLLESGNLNYGDIMILYQKWSANVEIIANKLSESGIPVSRAKMSLADQPVIGFLIDLGKFILDQYNDLAVYRILASKVVKFSHEELFMLCKERKSACLFLALDEIVSPWYERLLGISRAKGSAVEIYQAILVAFLEDLLRAYGVGAMKLIDVFMDFAFSSNLDLRNFINWLETERIDYKNEEAEGVQLMTVHMSKGREARIVFLVDCDCIPESHIPVLYNDDEVPIVVDGRTVKHPYCQALQQQEVSKQYAEYWRLLYVGLTRAKERVYMLGPKTRWKDSWSKEVKRFLNHQFSEDTFVVEDDILAL